MSAENVTHARFLQEFTGITLGLLVYIKTKLSPVIHTERARLPGTFWLSGVSCAVRSTYCVGGDCSTDLLSELQTIIMP